MTQVDLSALELDGIEDIEEPHAMPAGEYLVRVANAEFRNSKAGNPMLQLICEFPDEPNGAGVFDFTMLVTKATPEMSKARMLLDLRRKFHAFDVPYSSTGFDPGAFIGQECTMYVAVEQDQNGIDRNRLTPSPIPKGAETPKGDPKPF